MGLKRCAPFTICLVALLFCRQAQSQDPATVAAAIAEVASIIKTVSDLFGNNGNETKEQLDKIDARMAQMQLQLNVIEHKIDLIQAGLVSLGIEIRADLDEQQRFVVISEIGIITQNFKTWRQAWNPQTKTWRVGWNPQQHPEVPDPRTVLTPLQLASLNLKNRDSYANYTTVALAMVYERALMTVLGVRMKDDSVLQSFRSYHLYFQNATNPSGVGDTVGKHLLALVSARDGLNADVASRGQLLCDLGPDQCNRGDDYNIRVLQVIAGTLTNGFQGTPERRYIAVNGHHHYFNSKVGDLNPLKACEPANLYVPAGVRTDSCPAGLNALASSYQVDVAGIDALTKAVDHLKDLITLSEQWGGGAAKPPIK